MTVNQIILAALAPLGHPVAPDVYAGKERTYFSFNYNALGALYADDRPQYEQYLVQVHLFCPADWDSVSLRKETKHRLFCAGFTWPEETNAGGSYGEVKREGQHYVFECEIEEGVEPDGWDCVERPG